MSATLFHQIRVLGLMERTSDDIDSASLLLFSTPIVSATNVISIPALMNSRVKID